MTENSATAHAIDVSWEKLGPGAEISATVIMASGFVLSENSRVRERYRIAEKLGAGGMGQVLAVTLVGSTDHQTYALKVVARTTENPKNSKVDPAEAAEAAEQAKAFAQLLRQEAAKQDVIQRHGVSVARLFALVQLDDGSIGLRMELAQGRSLETRIERERDERSDKPPDVIWAVTAVKKLFTQLRRLHEMTEASGVFGFIHSDIKPGNVFIDDRDRSDPLVTLLDFGVATAGQALANDIASRHAGRKTLILQQTGGTIGYAPPGHFFGKPTPLSDVYSSLVIMFELITLHSPWDFGGMSKAPSNIRKVESLMGSRPRGVRTVRPSIPNPQAFILDQFFAREIAALNQLATSASDLFSMDDARERDAMIKRLSTLAQDYQVKLEKLLSDLTSPSLSLSDQRTSVEEIDATVAQGPRRDDASLSEDDLVADGDVDDLSLSVDSTYGSLDNDTSLPKRNRSSAGLWLMFFVMVAAGAGAGYWYYGGQGELPDRIRAMLRNSPFGDTNSNASVDGSIPDTGAEHVLARSLPPAPDVVAVSLAAALDDTDAGANEVGDAGHHDPIARATQRCECSAQIEGAVVVAQGGSLENEIVLCNANQRGESGEFVGNGVIPAEVIGAFPAVICRAGREVMALAVHRRATDSGSESVFECQRVATVIDAGVDARAAQTIASAINDAGTDSIAPRVTAIEPDVVELAEEQDEPDAGSTARGNNPPAAVGAHQVPQQQTHPTAQPARQQPTRAGRTTRPAPHRVVHRSSHPRSHPARRHPRGRGRHR